MAADQSDIEEFLSGPLVTWVSKQKQTKGQGDTVGILQLATSVKKPESLQVYEFFFDGGPISEVLLKIDPEPLQLIPTSSTSMQGFSITLTRIKTYHCILKNIKNLYEVGRSAAYLDT